MNDNKKEIIELLRSTERPGIENVITWLDTTPSFFVASGARIHHDNVVGGLAYHSLKVFKLAKMVIPHGIRRTIARGTVFAPYDCSKNLG